MTDWDPGVYERYADHRLRPALDLIGRLRGDPREIWDLGCGTGVITAMLAERWPGARVHGLDSSPAMLERARMIDGIDWVLGDISSWSPDPPPDLVFSNAALHWVDDHRAVFPRLVQHLVPGGTLAVQMPRNFTEPSHTLLAETASTPRWSPALGHVAPPEPPVWNPSAYHRALDGLVASIDIWETTYVQRLDGEDPVARWARATAARPYLEAAGDEAEAFMADYAARLRAAYPPEPDGTTLFPFRRLFIVASTAPLSSGP